MFRKTIRSCLLWTLTTMALWGCMQANIGAKINNKVHSIPQRIVSYEGDLGSFDCEDFIWNVFGYDSVQEMLDDQFVADNRPFITTAEGAALVADALFAAMYGMDTAVEITGEYIPLKVWQDKTNKAWVISRQHPKTSSDGAALPVGTDRIVIRPDGQVIAIWTTGAKHVEKPSTPSLETAENNTKRKITVVPTNEVTYEFCGYINYKTYMNKYGKGIVQSMTKSAIERNIIRTVHDGVRVTDALFTALYGNDFNNYDVIIDPIPPYWVSVDTEYNMWFYQTQNPPKQPDGTDAFLGYVSIIMQESDGRVVSIFRYH